MKISEIVSVLEGVIIASFIAFEGRGLGLTVHQLAGVRVFMDIPLHMLLRPGGGRGRGFVRPSPLSARPSTAPSPGPPPDALVFVSRARTQWDGERTGNGTGRLHRRRGLAGQVLRRWRPGTRTIALRSHRPCPPPPPLVRARRVSVSLPYGARPGFAGSRRRFFLGLVASEARHSGSRPHSTGTPAERHPSFRRRHHRTSRGHLSSSSALAMGNVTCLQPGKISAAWPKGDGLARGS